MDCGNTLVDWEIPGKGFSKPLSCLELDFDRNADFLMDNSIMDITDNFVAIKLFALESNYEDFDAYVFELFNIQYALLDPIKEVYLEIYSEEIQNGELHDLSFDDFFQISKEVYEEDRNDSFEKLCDKMHDYTYA